MPGIFGFDRIEIIDEPLDAGQRLPVIAVPRIALDTLQLARDVFGFSWVLMRQSLGVLPEDGQPYGDMKPVKDVLGTWGYRHGHVAHAIATVGEKDDILVHLEALLAPDLVQAAARLVVMALDQAEIVNKRRVFDGDAIRARIPPPFPVA